MKRAASRSSPASDPRHAAAVAITGMGIVSPFGVGRARWREALRAAEDGIRPIERFDPGSIRCTLAGEVRGFAPQDYDASDRFCRLPRLVQFAVLAADEAIASARLELAQLDPSRIGVFAGTWFGATEDAEAFLLNLFSQGAAVVSPLKFQNTTYVALAGEINLRLQLTGPSVVLVSGSTSGLAAVELAAMSLRLGRIDCALVVAAEELSAILLRIFAQLRLLPSGRRETQRSCPCDARRKGLLLGEGAAAVVLETQRHAAARRANVAGLVAGCGSSHAARQPRALHPDGRGMIGSMQAALREADCSPGDLDLIVAAANSTPAFDAAETEALKAVLGARAARIPVTCPKSACGETGAAAGLFQLAAGLFALDTGIIPATLNYQEPDPGCDLDYVPNVPRAASIRSLLCHSAAFGGASSSVVIAAAAPVRDEQCI
ncbi:MAG: beta-ketoacyl-[acyl-carrier-protein] synthase family protein [Candidatus Tectomicrobia bacterium]|nr:beta-ketoacyl-[acyl-carrier-protein] synthase family protein [Candidatus Tectomicrobia bacterium]